MTDVLEIQDEEYAYPKGKALGMSLKRFFEGTQLRHRTRSGVYIVTDDAKKMLKEIGLKELSIS